MLEDFNRNFCHLTHATLQSVKYLFPCPSNTIVHRRKMFPWNMIFMSWSYLQHICHIYRNFDVNKVNDENKLINIFEYDNNMLIGINICECNISKFLLQNEILVAVYYALY